MGATGRRPGERARAEQILEAIAGLVAGPASFMEVCGTHTMAIGRSGLRARLPRGLRLLSGPGCPVCVTPCSILDRAVAMAREPGVVIATFGDMMRVPASSSSLDRERARGRDVRVLYSPYDALRLAAAEPARLVVFVGVGFETTSPTVAATLVRALDQKLPNFCVLPAFKLVPPAMAALVDDGAAGLQGFLCPGHVSAIIGSRPYEPVAKDRGVPCVVAGFEPLDILEGIAMLLAQVRDGRAEVEVQYSRAVRPEGNPAARDLLSRVFRPCDAAWRGIGEIRGSGLEFSEEFSGFDARTRVPVEVGPSVDLPEGCGCGDVMRGKIVPPECPLFGTVCHPADPVGPCMVSSEGACAAYYRYQ